MFTGKRKPKNPRGGEREAGEASPLWRMTFTLHFGCTTNGSEKCKKPEAVQRTMCVVSQSRRDSDRDRGAATLLAAAPTRSTTTSGGFFPLVALQFHSPSTHVLPFVPGRPMVPGTARDLSFVLQQRMVKPKHAVHGNLIRDQEKEMSSAVLRVPRAPDVVAVRREGPDQITS